MRISKLLSFFSFKGILFPISETYKHPPFSIQKKTKVNRRFKPNEGTISKSTISRYKIFYKDSRLSFPKTLDKPAVVPGIWRAYFLKSAPSPTVLTASKNIYLITEENDVPKFTLIEKNFSNYASLQWLDSENGQPGEKTEILIGEDKTDCELTGGELLLLHANIVLQISDLSLFSFKKSTDLTDGYYDNRNALAFSPDKSQIVFSGSKSHEINRTEFIHALLVYNFKTNQAYTLPIDKTETRLHDPYSISTKWVYTFFEWQQSNTNTHILAKKNLPKLPYWEGHYSKIFNYYLKPVKEAMFPVFFKFLKEILHLEKANIRPDNYDGAKRYFIKHNEFTFETGYSKDFSSVSFSISFMNKGSNKKALAIIKKTGDAFNKILKEGTHQSLFTNY